MPRRYNPGLQGQISRLTVVDGTFSSIVSDEDITIAPSGTGDIFLNADTVRVGDENTNVALTTWGTGDLTISTNSGTNSGNITIPDGANASISITPNGIGDVRLNADTVRVGDQNTNATVTTWGSADLILNTNGGTNSGAINILDGSGANIEIYPNGTGNIALGNGASNNVLIGATTASTSTNSGALQVGGGIGAAGNIYAGGNIVVSGTATASAPTAGTHLTTKTYTDTVGGLSWTAVNTNTNMTNLGNYFVDTSSGVVEMTLPGSAVAGFRVKIVDANRSFGENNCIVRRNGANIEGLAEDLDLDVNEVCLELVYLNASSGWKVTNLI